jgi:hypothetical protein
MSQTVVLLVASHLVRGLSLGTVFGIHVLAAASSVIAARLTASLLPPFAVPALFAHFRRR